MLLKYDVNLGLKCNFDLTAKNLQVFFSLSNITCIDVIPFEIYWC